MKRSRRRRGLVIDASVARAAGGVDATDPQAKSCRDALKATIDGGLFIVVSHDILEEWNAHRSNFARKWLTNMFGRRRVIRLETQEDADLRRALQRALQADDYEVVAKDLLLIEAALQTDRRILSADERTRVILVTVVDSVNQLNPLYWANPNADECLPWLENGAPDDEVFLLVHSAA